MNESLLKFYESKDEKERKELVENFLDDYKDVLFIVLNNILKKIELRSNAYLLNLMSKKKKVTNPPITVERPAIAENMNAIR